MNCPYCDHDLGDSYAGNFCPACGQKILRCSTCGEILKPGIKFCPNDGTPTQNENQHIPSQEYHRPSAQQYTGSDDATVRQSGRPQESNNYQQNNYQQGRPQQNSYPPGRPSQGTTPYNRYPTGKTASKKNNKKPIIIAIILAILLLALGAGIAIAAKKLSEDDKKTESVSTDKNDSNKDSDHLDKDEEDADSNLNSELVTNKDSDKESNSSDKTDDKSDSDKKNSDTADKDDDVTDDDRSDPYEDAYDEDVLCSYSSSRMISDDDYRNLSAQYSGTRFPGDRNLAQMIQNEIYARNGYEFTSQELKDYFNAFSWYQEVRRTYSMSNDQKVVTGRMNSIERANIDLLEKYKP